MRIDMLKPETWPVPQACEIEVWLNGRRLFGVLKADDETGHAYINPRAGGNDLEPHEVVPGARDGAPIIVRGRIEFRRDGVAIC